MYTKYNSITYVITTPSVLTLGIPNVLKNDMDLFLR